MNTINNKSNLSKIAIVNNQTISIENAKVSIASPGLTFAITVFEGVRAYWNQDHNQLYIFRLNEHLERLNFSVNTVEMSPAPDFNEIKKQVINVLHQNNVREDVYIRIQTYVDDWGDMMSKGPVSTSITCQKRPRVPAYFSGKNFMVSSWRRNSEDSSPPRIKSSANYLNGRLAGLEAKRTGYDGAILLNRNGTVSEGPGGCIFIIRKNKIITPSLSSGVLESITRDTLISLASDINIETLEREIGRTELYLADEAFYCGTAQEIVPILSVDRKLINNGKPGPITRKIQDQYDKTVRGNISTNQILLTKVYN
tara:strand:+ start:2828 stop:3763 length:936 start_codon:yes stop_codon:yes gene_type:complete